MPHTKHIFLIGFSGSGKSTLGPLLAELLKARFVDIDFQIAQKAGRSISDIFAQRGEAVFRRLEEQAVRSQLRQRGERTVLALGGGAFENPAIRKLAKAHGTVVYLSCSRREIYRRLRGKTDRPLLQVSPAAGLTPAEALRKSIARLLDRRLPRYRTADVTVSTGTRTPARAARLIQGLIREFDEVD